MVQKAAVAPLFRGREHVRVAVFVALHDRTGVRGVEVLLLAAALTPPAAVLLVVRLARVVVRVQTVVTRVPAKKSRPKMAGVMSVLFFSFSLSLHSLLIVFSVISPRLWAVSWSPNFFLRARAFEERQRVVKPHNIP